MQNRRILEGKRCDFEVANTAHLPNVGTYRYCIVAMSMCSSTTKLTSNKLLFYVPKKWCLGMKQKSVKNKQLSAKSHCFVCEDHFDVNLYFFFLFLISYTVKKLNILIVTLLITYYFILKSSTTTAEEFCSFCLINMFF